MYHTVAGGVPSPADVDAAVQDIEALYKACAADKRLVDCHEVTSGLAFDVAKRIIPVPLPGLVGADFPA